MATWTRHLPSAGLTFLFTIFLFLTLCLSSALHALVQSMKCKWRHCPLVGKVPKYLLSALYYSCSKHCSAQVQNTAKGTELNRQVLHKFNRQFKVYFYFCSFASRVPSASDQVMKNKDDLMKHAEVKHHSYAVKCSYFFDGRLYWMQENSLTPMISSTSSVLWVLATWAAMVVPNAMGPEGMRLGGPSLAPVGVNKHKLYWEAQTRTERETETEKQVSNICIWLLLLYCIKKVFHKHLPHLHCCILPRSKVQIHQLLLL